MTNLPMDVDLDLDSVQRPAAEAVDPFKARVSGRVIVMTDPEEIDWQDLLDMATPVDFLRHCVSSEDREFLRGEKIAGWKFGRLMKAYQEHYKIDEKIAQHQREQGRANRF